jgi:UDP-N-acetyl-D-mannosaminuronic acid dehydrogenase
MTIETVCVLGLGYIGLPTAAILASRGKRVIGVDVQIDVVDSINRGEIHIVEPDLDAVVRVAVADGLIRAQLQPAAADVFMIAVPTPFKGDDHQPDLGYVEAACRSIATHLKTDDLVILESTSPVGTTLQMAHWLAQERPDLKFPHEHGEESDIRIAYCPERVLPGHVLRELVSNDRIIGGLTKACADAAIKLYEIFVEGQCIVTNAATAEMCKLTENSFRDVNIAFANELSLVCDQQGINVWELIRLANRHPRVNILQPGPGVGGHCIAVDPWFIVSSAPETARIIRTAREVNDSKPDWVIGKVKAALDAFKHSSMHKSASLAILGLSFKPDIDDLRESPAMEIAEKLCALDDLDVLCVEPNITSIPKTLIDKISLVDLENAISKADIILLLVDHKEFKAINKSRFSGKHLIDTRGIWDGQIGTENFS